MNKLKLMESLSKIFNFEGEYHKLPKCPFMILDPSNVLGVYGRNKSMKRLLLNFLDEDQNSISLKQYSDNSVGDSSTRYSTDYLNKIMEFFEVLGENPKIKCGNGQPIRLVGETIGFILAPRIEA